MKIFKKATTKNYPYSITFGEIYFIMLLPLLSKLFFHLPIFVCLASSSISEQMNLHALSLAYTHAHNLLIIYQIVGFKAHSLWGDGSGSRRDHTFHYISFSIIFHLFASFFAMHANKKNVFNEVYRSNNDGTHTTHTHFNLLSETKDENGVCVCLWLWL